MPRLPKGQPPKYRKHSRDNIAVVTVTTTEGVRTAVRLGPWDSPASRAEYARVLGVLAANNGRWPVDRRPDPNGVSVAEVVFAFMEYAARRYTAAGGAECKEFRFAVTPLIDLFDETPAAQFGPKKLTEVRDRMIAADLCRNVVNRRVGRIRQVFRWATAQEMIPGGVHQALAAVAALSPGECGVRESTPRAPAFWDDVEKVVPFCTACVGAMLRVQALTGMRSGEVRKIRPLDIDRSGEVWVYRPGSNAGPFGAHKNAWRGQRREVQLGPRAVEILTPFLAGKQPGDYLFNPRQMTRDSNNRRSLARKSKPTPKQAERIRRNRAVPVPNCCYTQQSYPQAVAKACLKAGVRFDPYSLRHGAKMTITREHGADAARAVLGQKSIQTTAFYGTIDAEHAADVMRKAG
jgi:integrase